MQLSTLNNLFSDSEFKVFKDTIASGGIVTGLVASCCAGYSRNQLDGLTKLVKELGAGGLVWFKVKDDSLESPVAKFLSDDEKNNLVNEIACKTGRPDINSCR